MPAKKKPAKKPVRRPTAEERRRREDNMDLMSERSRLKDELRNACASRDQLAADLQRVLAERDEARKELAEARRGREAWCHKAVECEQRAERAEEQLKVLLAGITSQRPSKTVEELGLKGLRSPEPGPTYGLPGDAPTTRFSREFRG